MSDEPYAMPIMHRAADGTLTMDWPGNEPAALCSRPFLEQFVGAVNENVRLVSENRALKEQLAELRAFDEDGGSSGYRIGG